MMRFRIPSRVLNDEDHLEENNAFVDSDETMAPSDTSSESGQEDCPNEHLHINETQNESLIIVGKKKILGKY